MVALFLQTFLDSMKRCLHLMNCCTGENIIAIASLVIFFMILQYFLYTSREVKRKTKVVVPACPMKFEEKIAFSGSPNPHFADLLGTLDVLPYRIINITAAAKDALNTSASLTEYRLRIKDLKSLYFDFGTGESLASQFTERNIKLCRGSSKDLETYGHFHHDSSFLRLPPPGGTILQESIRQGVVTSFILSRHFMQLSRGAIHITIFIDVDYTHAIGRKSHKIFTALERDLHKLFQFSNMKVENFSVRRGSVIVSFEVNNENRDQTMHKDITELLIQADSTGAVLMNAFKTGHSRQFSGSTLQIHRSHSEVTKHQTVTSNLHDAQTNFRWLRRRLLQQSTSRRTAEFYQSVPLAREEETAIYQLDRTEEEERPVWKSASTGGDSRVAVRFSVVGNYDTVVGDRRKDFQAHIRGQMAREMRVPLSSIQDISIENGIGISFIVTATNDENNIMDDESVADAVDDLKTRIKEKRLRLTDLNLQPLVPVPDGFISSQDDETDFTPIILGLLITVLVLVFILIIFAAIITRNITTTNSKKVSSKRNKAYRPIAAVETGRDSSHSIGKYSYDSGLWLGPGPEPMYTVPEAPLYRPPTADQVSSTPRPGTAVRTRLKRNWNIDDRTLTPMPDEVEMPWERRMHDRRQKHLDTISESNT